MYDNTVDIWALGVLTFILLTGRKPYYGLNGKNEKAVYRDILKTKLDIDQLIPSCSPEARFFVKQALQWNKWNRPEAIQMLQYDWIRNVAFSDPQIHDCDQLNISANLAQFQRTTTLQSTVCSIIANLLTESSDIALARDMFLQWDSDQDGYISRKELRENIKNATEIFKVKEPNFLAILNAMDSDRDGYIDFTEFITAALDKHKLLAAPMINKAFKLLDYD